MPVPTATDVDSSATDVVMRGMAWCRLRDGKLVEGWQCSNIPEVVRKLAANATEWGEPYSSRSA